MLTLAMPQSEPVADRKRLRLAQVVREDGRGQALRHVVLQPNGFIEVRVTHHVEDRREGFARTMPICARHLAPARAARNRRHRPDAARRARRHAPCRRHRVASSQRTLHRVERVLRRSAGRRACLPRADRRPLPRRRPASAAAPGVIDARHERTDGAASCSAGRRCPSPRTRWRAARDPDRRTARRWRRCCRRARGGAGETRGEPRPDRAAHGGRAGRRDERHAADRSTSASPTSRPPISNARQAFRRIAERRSARSNSACTASAVSGVFSDGFQTTESPQTSASAAFHAHTATGKLNAEMTPTTPSGCQVSIIRCSARSVAMVRPYSWRDRPTA